MDQQATTLLASLRRTASSSESKLTLLNNLKSDIKHYRVPDNAQATIFECLRLAISQQTSSSLVTAAFSTLSHLFKRLKIQDAEGKAIAAFAPKLLPVLEERLGDQRDGYRTGASQALVELWPFCTAEVERVIREEAIPSTNVREKLEGIQWVVRMEQDASLQFKSFVPAMVTCLEDHDGSVRDAAKSALIDLFRPASTAAKNDLKRQLRLHEVRQSITTQILTAIGANSSAPPAPATSHHPDVDLAASTRSLPNFDHIHNFAESINSEEARPPPAEEVSVDPIFVHSQYELEDVFREMTPWFEGKETEENWNPRDKSILKLRRLTKGNAPSEYHAAYMTGLKSMQEPSLKTANSLRTTVATNACQLVRELARTLGPAMDSMADNYLQSFIKMCAATKHIAAQNGNQTVETIFQYVSYNPKLMNHISWASQDKNRQPRVFAAGWMRTVLNKQSGSKIHFENTGGLDVAEKTIRKCLEDPDPKVKEGWRATYWTYAKLWPEKAETLINAVDPKVKTALERDPHNPNASKVSQSSFSASTNARGGGARSSLRDRIAADKRAAASKQPSRPVTAMAAMSPAKSKSMANLSSVAKSQSMAPPTVPGSSRVASNASVSSTATSKSTDSAASVASNATVKQGSLMSGAARRPVRKPELNRPQTADPYAARRLGRPETPSNQSPKNSPRQSTTARSTTVSSTAARNRLGRVASPAASPSRNGGNSKQLIDSRPSSKDHQNSLPEDQDHNANDDFTMIIPGTSREAVHSATRERRRPHLDKSMSIDSGIPAVVEDDNFTLVMPAGHTMTDEQQERSPLARRSPARGESASHIPLPASPRNSIHGTVQSPPPKSRSPSAISPSAQRKRLEPEDRRNTSAEDGRNGVRSRSGSPLKMSTFPQSQQEESVQIYEDPFVAENQEPSAAQTNVSQPSGVLTELPLNESQRSENENLAQPESPSARENVAMPNGDGQIDGHVSPPQSPQKAKAEVLRLRKLLHSGTERIRARTLDTHGFRRMADLVRTSDSSDLFGHDSKRYDDLMLVLCEFIGQAAPESTFKPDGVAPKGTELKRQALSLLRPMLVKSDQPLRKWNIAGSWHARALSSALRARSGVETLGMIVKDIEAVCIEAVRSAESQTSIIDAIDSFLTSQRNADNRVNGHDFGAANGDHEPSRSSSGSQKAQAHATALALRTLTSSLSASTSSLAGSELDRTSSLTAPNLRSREPEVRKSAVELATQLYIIWPGSEPNMSSPPHANGDFTPPSPGRAVQASKQDYWSALDRNCGPNGMSESTKNLITYFVARRHGAVEGRS